MLKKICRDTPIIGPCEKKLIMTPLPTPEEIGPSDVSTRITNISEKGQF